MRFRVTLTCRSPLHVGGTRHVLGPLDFVQAGDVLYPVRLRALEEWLAERGLVPAFARWVTGEAGGLPTLSGFLQAQRLLTPDLARRLAAYGVRLASPVPPTRVLAFARDPFGRPYLPGSSLKGALRTAWLAAGFSDPRLADRLVDDVRACVEEAARQSPTKRRASATRVAAGAEERALRTLSFPPQYKATPLHRDVWRAIRVRDSAPLDPGAVRVYEVGVLSRRRDGTPYRKPTGTLCAECLIPGTRVEFEVTVEEGWRGVPWSSVAEVFERVADWSRERWNEEKSAVEELCLASADLAGLREFYAGAPAGVRLGWGSGWRALGVGSRLPRDLQRRVGEVFYDRTDSFPKSRKVIVDRDRIMAPLGWADLSVDRG